MIYGRRGLRVSRKRHSDRPISVYPTGSQTGGRIHVAGEAQAVIMEYDFYFKTKREKKSIFRFSLSGINNG